MTRRFRLVVLLVLALVLIAGAVPVSAASNNPVHIVRRGETLYSIARRYGVNTQAIARANHLVNPNLIYAGQRLVIPTGWSGGRARGGTVHIVRRGETLSGIAYRYGVSMWAVIAANNIANRNLIYAGQRLTIP